MVAIWRLESSRRQLLAEVEAQPFAMFTRRTIFRLGEIRPLHTAFCEFLVGWIASSGEICGVGFELTNQTSFGALGVLSASCGVAAAR